MKKKLGAVVFGLVVIFGFGSVVSEKAQADIPEGFLVHTKTTWNNHQTTYEILHEDTGCYYLFNHDSYNYQSSGLEQIYVEKDGVVVPYCK